MTCFVMNPDCACVEPHLIIFSDLQIIKKKMESHCLNSSPREYSLSLVHDSTMWFRKCGSALGNTLEIVYIFSDFFILANVSIGKTKSNLLARCIQALNACHCWTVPYIVDADSKRNLGRCSAITFYSGKSSSDLSCSMWSNDVSLCGLSRSTQWRIQDLLSKNTLFLWIVRLLEC